MEQTEPNPAGVLIATNQLKSLNDPSTRNNVEGKKDENLENFSKTNLKEIKNDLIHTASMKREEILMSPK
jgi:hypothetical protein